MKKKLLASMMALAMVLSLAACGEPAGSNEPSGNVTPTAASVDDDVAARNASIQSYLSNYLTTGYQPDSNGFMSNMSTLYVLSPKFAVADVNNDGYTDIVVWGETGIRDLQMTEVFTFNPNDGTFYVNTFSGVITGTNNGYILVSYDDRDVATPTYYEDTYIYEIYPSVPDEAYSYPEEVVACKKVITYDDNSNENVTVSYYEHRNELSPEDYESTYASYLKGEILTLNFEEMTEETILKYFPDAIGIGAKG